MSRNLVQVFLEPSTGKIYQLNPVSKGKELGTLLKPSMTMKKKSNNSNTFSVNSLESPKNTSESVQQSVEVKENNFNDDNYTFAPFTWKKRHFLKTPRGDVLTEDMEWVGRWNEKSGKLNTSAPQPHNLNLGGGRRKRKTRKGRKN